MPNPGPNIEGSTMTLGAVAPGAGHMLLTFYLALSQIVNNTDFMTAAPAPLRGA